MKTFFKLPPENSLSAARTGGAKQKEYSAYVRLWDIVFFDKNPNGTTLISLRNGKIVTFDDPDDKYFDQLVKYTDGFTEAVDYYWPIEVEEYKKHYRNRFGSDLDMSQDTAFRPID